MTAKNFGPGVSGYLDPDGRAWETTVYQASKPILDRELNLAQDEIQRQDLRFRRQTMPSGWISSDFLDTADMTGGFFTAPGTANNVQMPTLLAHVNGWLVQIVNTNSNGSNILSLGAGPAGAGAKRTDIVILEVWRALVSASPSAVNKSPAGRIWLNGNVKVRSADDLTLNFADDILDGAVGSETTKRVQIQYRLRVVTNVDVFAYPNGIDDPSVFANTIPPNAATPDGTASTFNFVNQSSVGDPGLWVAGDGNPANALGTVDGYMYAIPLMAVFRRNTTGFDRNTNQNGGVASPGPSDRPDGLFYDMIVARDIQDLRHGVSPDGWDFTEILNKNFNWLLDNVLQTELIQTSIGGGVRGNVHLWADQIGISNAHGGDGVITGSTPGGPLVGEFDAVRRYFSDRTIHETVVVWFQPTDGSGGGPNWANGDTVTIDPTALKSWPYSPYNWASFAPSNVTIMGVERAHFLGPGSVGTNGSSAADANSGFYSVNGVGAVPMTSLTFRIDTVPTGITNSRLFIWLEIAYPIGVGLTKTPTATLPGTISVNNPGQLPAGAPVLFEAITASGITDFPHREALLQYNTVSQTFTVRAEVSSVVGPYPIFMPERVLSVSAILINGGPYGGSITIDETGYIVTLAASSVNPGDNIQVTFKALRPLPQNGEQLTLYYDAMAPQPARDAILSTSLNVIPRHVSPFLYSLAVGSGSPDTAYPFEKQYVQMPGIYPTSGGTFSGDQELASSSEMVLTNFSGDSGFLKMETLIPAVPNPNELTFNRAPGDIDSEGRSYFKSIPVNIYLPNAFAQAFNDIKRHRCVLPMLCELSADSSLGQKGQLVLVVLGSYQLPDISGTASSANAIGFNPDLTQNVTTASVYRIKGNLLNRRSS